MGTNPGRPTYPRPAGLAPLRSVPRLQSRGKVTHPQCSESWIGRQFDRMDRKALTWIKGPTRQCQIKHKTVKHLPGTITSVHVRRRCNGGPRGARGRPAGLPQAGRPSNCLHQDQATVTNPRIESGASRRRRWPNRHDPRPASLGGAGRPHLAAAHLQASRGS